MTEVEFVPFRLTEAADVYTIRIDGKEKTEFHEFMMTFKNSGDNYLADDFHRILNTLNILTTQGIKEYHFRPEGRFSDKVTILQLIDRELKRLEEDGLDVNSVINNLTINI